MECSDRLNTQLRTRRQAGYKRQGLLNWQDRGFSRSCGDGFSIAAIPLGLELPRGLQRYRNLKDSTKTSPWKPAVITMMRPPPVFTV